MGRKETIHTILKQFYEVKRKEDKQFFCLYGKKLVGKSVLLREVAYRIWLAQGNDFSDFEYFDLDQVEVKSELEDLLKTEGDRI